MANFLLVLLLSQFQYIHITDQALNRLSTLLVDPNPLDDQPVVLSPSTVSSLFGDLDSACVKYETLTKCVWSESSRSVTIIYSSGYRVVRWDSVR